jgi:hypothetical protein
MGFMDSLFGPPCTGCKRRTRQIVGGAAVCPACETKDRAQHESLMDCPKCGLAMTKVVDQTVIYDKCSSCGGVWLDKSELESLVAIASAAGMASGQGTGMVVGMMMDSHHH